MRMKALIGRVSHSRRWQPGPMSSSVIFPTSQTTSKASYSSPALERASPLKLSSPEHWVDTLQTGNTGGRPRLGGKMKVRCEGSLAEGCEGNESEWRRERTVRRVRTEAVLSNELDGRARLGRLGRGRRAGSERVREGETSMARRN